MYEVFLHPDAQNVYVNADKALAKKIARCLQQLEQTPQSHPNVKAFKQGGFIQGNEKHDAVDSPKLSGLVEQCATPAFLPK